MNRTVYYALAFAGLTAISSCSSSDIPSEVASSENESVVFKIEVPTSLGTRAGGALGDVITADLTNLDYTVYKIEGSGDSKTATKVYSQSNTAFEVQDTEEVLNIALLKNVTYQVVFCAYNKDNGGFITYSDGTVTINYSKAVANNKDQDLFVGKSEEFTVTAPSTQSVQLTRPFAQLNWGSIDVLDGIFKDENGNIKEDMTATVKISQESIYNTLNVRTGEVSNPTSANDGGTDISLPTLYIKDIPAAKENNTILFPVENTANADRPYHLIAMNYLLVKPSQSASQAVSEDNESGESVAGSTATISITVTNVNESETDKDVTITIDNAPLVPNYRTNIYGSLLSCPSIFNLSISQSFSNSTDNNDQYNHNTDNRTPENSDTND